jgi:DNA-binding MarR family transcriptional regulator
MSSQSNFIKAMENWANVYLFRSLTEYFEYLKTTGISMQQAYALTFIHYNGPSKISDICEHMMATAAAASQLVDRLEIQNLVERVADPGDRRVRNVVLSVKGEKFVQQSIAARQNWVRQIPPELSSDELDQIASVLQKLSAAYQE